MDYLDERMMNRRHYTSDARQIEPAPPVFLLIRRLCQ